jgi:hypothetical protein
MFGKFLSALINRWLRVTGRKIKLSEYPWLDGPIGGKYIGDEFYKEYAEKNNLVISVPPESGLMVDFTVLGSNAHPNLQPGIKHFYEKTILYKMNVWSQAFYPIKPFAKILIKTISHEINQLNIPLDPMETSKGMSSEVIRLSTKEGEPKMTCWLRKNTGSNKVVYSGFYSAIKIDNQPFVRVVFPLPNGNVTVILEPEFREDGSFRLISTRRKFGKAGYYRVKEISPGIVKVRLIPLKESIHVYEDEHGVLRTDHEFRFWGMKFLKLHYQLMEKVAADSR